MSDRDSFASSRERLSFFTVAEIFSFPPAMWHPYNQRLAGLPANEYLWFGFLPRGAAYNSPGSEKRHPGVATPTRTSSYPAGVT